MANGGYKVIPVNGRGQIHLGQIHRSEAKRLRRAARGARGTARGRVVDAPTASTEAPAEGEAA